MTDKLPMASKKQIFFSFKHFVVKKAPGGKA